MKIAFTAQGKTKESKVDARFGRCPYFVIVDTETNEIKVIDNSDSNQEAHGAGPKTAQKLANEKIDVIVTGNGPGGNASTLLSKMNIKIFVGAADMIITEALDAYIKKELKEF